MNRCENKERLIAKVLEISKNVSFVKQSSIKHGLRFIEKLDKIDAIKDHTDISCRDDGNLTFHWEYSSPRKSKFNIDFDEDNDKLLWCCEIEGINDVFYGESCHLEDISKYLIKYLNGEKK